ncbi:S8 family serine peptidase [Neobacillus sp. NPDC058068]|uniref:S8 family serine peptidase n=1 Tax=Neobacillus sp. NPDC058068 TaxID=3346325 RepID=UPI0036DBF311
MKKRNKLTKRIISISLLIAMLLNIVLAQNVTLVHAAANPSQKNSSSGAFNAKEVNRILDSLTSEQKANINKLTGADDAQKIHLEQKDLRSSKNINVIVQFKEDPAKIQIIKQSLAKGGATVNSQAFADQYSAAQKKVAESHAKFKSFVKTQASATMAGGKSVKNRMEITREYTDAFNGVALSLPPNQVAKLAEYPDVASIWPAVEYTADPGSTDQTSTTSGSVGKPTDGLKWLGIDKLQADGHTGIIKSGPRAGQKVKVGVLDTGIDYNHPDLKAVYKGGHDLVNNTVDGDGNIIFVDDLDPMETTYDDWVAAKTRPDPIAGPPPADYKQYITSHGTHVSGTIAANTTNNNDVYSANGVAPNVDLYGYRVLGPGGHGTSVSVLSGIDQAVKDQMDVINLSLGANVNDPMYPTSIAINNATLAGVVCAVAAGNSGPGKATVGSPGTSALAITVGASTIPESIPVMTLKNGSNSYQARLFGKNFSQADDVYKGKTFPIVDVGLGSAANYIGIDMSGKIALVHRGVDYLQTKMANAKNAGAAGMIIWNNSDDTASQGYIPSFLGVSMDNVYSVSLTQSQGQALSDAIAKDPNNATITFPAKLDTPLAKNADELASFSSTGPVKDWTIKPDVVAPGVDISSTAPYDIWEPQDKTKHDYQYAYQIMSGTSMATPHVAGIAALVLAAHPDYSPADVKTALMNTAKDINTDTNKYSVYQVGAGRVDPARAINADVKIQVLDQAYTYDKPDDSNTIRQIDNLTGSMFFGFKGRGEGATNGSDDVVSSKDFNVANLGTSSKTFNVNTKFITSKFAGSNPVGPGTGNDVKIDFSAGGTNGTSINVGGGRTVKATATITVPSNALEGTYEGYISLVNAADSSESYRIPFTITVAEKGINFKVITKAFTLPESMSGNFGPDTPNYTSGFTFSVTSAMENMYLVLKDKNGNYLGITNYYDLSKWAPGTQSRPLTMLFMGQYYPFTKPYNGSFDPTGIANSTIGINPGAYSVEMIATDKDGKRYTAEDTVYVDITAPIMTMDNDSKPGIYEIDPTGYQPGQEIKGFYGSVYDSNIDIMKKNGETSVPSLQDWNKLVPIDQSLNLVWGYQDYFFPTVIFNTDSKGRFHFGVTREDLASKAGSEFWIYPSDYSGASDVETGKQTYYFIKKGLPYLTWTSSGGVDAGPENQDKVVVDANKPFKTTIATKNGMGMTGGKFSLNDKKVYKFSNIRLSDEYKNYLISKDIDPSTVLTVGQPYPDNNIGGKSTDITISGIDAAGALNKDMNILEADVTYSNADPIVGPFNYVIRPDTARLTLSGVDTQVAAFPTNDPYVRQPISLLRGRIASEAFATNNVGSSFPPTTVDTGAKVTVTDTDGKTFVTDTPTTTDNNTVDYKFLSGKYAVTMDVSDKPYSVVTSMPGHFKGYAATPVIGKNKFGYQSGTVYDLPNLIPVLLGGDVNGDNVIDMKDLVAEVNTFYQYKNLNNFNNPENTLANKTAFLNSNRNADIYWIKPGTAGYGIDYNDFYYLFKNFGKQNQSAIDAGITVPTPQLTVDQDTTITTQYGGSITLNAGDGLQQVMQKLNFAGPRQIISGTTPTLQDLQKGSNITLIPTNTVFIDDVVWRKAITNILIGSTDVTSKVNISGGYTDQSGAHPSQITLPGSLFTATDNYSVTIKASGYQDVTVSITVKDTPIQTPVIPLVTDPAKAHLGKDLPFTFTDDANWRNGINNIMVYTVGSGPSSKGKDITSLRDNNGNLYYDISQPGKIIFKADLFKSNSTLTDETSIKNATLDPGGTNWLPQQYKFVVNSTGADGTVYPAATIGLDSIGSAGQAVGYGVTFDSQGGAPVSNVAVGYSPQRTRIDPNGNIGNQTFVGGIKNPNTTRPGYNLVGWFKDKEGMNPWDPSIVINSDITVYAKWQMSYTQNYSPVDTTKPNGLKFDGTNGSVSGIGWVLGEGNLNLTMPNSLTNVPWLTSKDKIAKIEATYYKIKSDGTTDSSPTTYPLDPSTFNLVSNGDGSGTLSFTTATHDAAVKAGQANLGQKFAFSELPSISNAGGIKGYKITVTATTGETLVLSDIRLGLRRHIDLNGGSLTNPTDLYFADSLVNGKATSPNMTTAVASSHVTNGKLSNSSTLYLDSANSPGMASPISNTNGVMLTDNTTFYICWIKTPPTVSKQSFGNTVGSDIKLTFTDDGTWKNNIKQVSIGSKVLVLNTDYTISDSAITLNHSLFTAGQKVNVLISSEGYADANVQDQVIGYLVTFDSNGGDSIAPQIVDRNATKPADPTKVGYKFVGWYMDQAFTKPFDFASIVTSPITLYAKYALAASLVTADTSDNCLGNDMTLDFSESDWAKAITGITVNGASVDGTKFKVDTASHTITLDKSLFTKAGDFAININASDYADVTVIQKVVNGYNVHFVVKDNAPFEVKDQIVARRITEPVVNGYDLTWYADEACTLPWVFTNSIYSDRTLYGKWTLHKFSVVFDHQDGSLVDSKSADYNTTITAPVAPTRLGYTFLGWYKDPAGKTAWNFATDKVTSDVRLYAKWISGVENNGLYNKDVTITFNEATATLDGKNFKSGTKVTTEGNHTLVVTDAAGNATTVQFTIDKTAPIVSGVSNNGSYNHDVTITFDKGTATLNGEAFTSGTVVSHEGTYTLIVTDKAGNVTTVEFTIDKTAPKAPTINSVSDNDTLVTGTTEANVTVFVKSNNTIIGTGTSDRNGKYQIKISKQKAGTVLTVFVKDAAGNESASAEVTVSKAFTQGWSFENGYWYYYTNTGDLLKNSWVQTSGKWYYLGASGKMATNEWLAYKGQWYYLGATGKMAANEWLAYKGQWYYLGATGKMVANEWLAYKGQWYYLGSTGKMAANEWLAYKGQWYYLGSTGKMAANEWLAYKGQWYYLGSTGKMVTGWVQVNKKWYFLYSDGHMAANTTIGKYKIGKDGVWIQ